jgi:hypothetical protein
LHRRRFPRHKEGKGEEVRRNGSGASRIVLVLSTIILVLSTVGCKSPSTVTETPYPALEVSIPRAADIIERAVNDLQTSVLTLKGTGAFSEGLLSPYAPAAIGAAADKIAAQVPELRAAAVAATSLTKTLRAKDVQIAALNVKLKAAQSSYGWLLRTISAGLGGLGILLLAGAAYLIIGGTGMTRAGMGAAAAGVVMTCGGLALTTLNWWLALAGAVALVLGIAGIVLKTVLDYRRATHEVVATVEMAKGRLTPSDKEAIFGHEAIAGTIQSPRTRAIVKKIREEPGFTKL